MVETAIPEKLHPVEAQPIEPGVEVTGAGREPQIPDALAAAGVTAVGETVHAAEAAETSSITVVGEHAPTTGLGRTEGTFSKPGEFPPVLTTGQFTKDGSNLGRLAKERIARLKHEPGENYTPPAENPGIFENFRKILPFGRKKPQQQAA